MEVCETTVNTLQVCLKIFVMLFIYAYIPPQLSDINVLKVTWHMK